MEEGGADFVEGGGEGVKENDKMVKWLIGAKDLGGFPIHNDAETVQTRYFGTETALLFYGHGKRLRFNLTIQPSSMNPSWDTRTRPF